MSGLGSEAVSEGARGGKGGGPRAGDHAGLQGGRERAEVREVEAGHADVVGLRGLHRLDQRQLLRVARLGFRSCGGLSFTGRFAFGCFLCGGLLLPLLGLRIDEGALSFVTAIC